MAAVRVAGEVLALFGAGSAGTYLVADALMGTSMACYLILWGVLLCEHDVATNERSFVTCFVLVGALLLVFCALPLEVVRCVLIVLPVAELACYALGSRQKLCAAEKPSPSSQQMSSERDTAAFVVLVVRTGIAITVVSLVWGMFAAGSSETGVSASAAFALGVLGAAAIIWLFTRYSPSVGFVASASWVLPVTAVGLAVSTFEGTAAMLAACFLLAAAHASFETILRLQIVRFAQLAAHDRLWTVGWGYAAIMAGAFVGDSIATCFVPHGEGIDATMAACVLAGLVVISVFLFPASRAMSGGGKPEPPVANTGAGLTSDAHERSLRLAAAHGLTARETEVLAHLLEGRSRPYIRDELTISISTVDTHIRHIYAKVGVETRQALIDASLR
jgi:DNA-binding CsgD family transcriptional regulator